MPADPKSAIELASELTALPGVGPRLAEKLARLNLHRVRDVLFHLPLRYQDRTRVVAIGALRPYTEAVVQGEIELSQVRYGRRRMLLVRISDGTGALVLRFFHFGQTQQANLGRGRLLRCFGEVRRNGRTLEIVHPEYRFIDPDAIEPVEETLTPVYPTTDGVNQAGMRRITDQALALLNSVSAANDPGFVELPPDIDTLAEMPTLRTALRYVHRPPPDVAIDALQEGSHIMQKRLAFDELLAHQLSARRLRDAVREHAAPALPDSGPLRPRWLADLPFELTAAQQRVIAEIDTDLAAGVPMLRLVQGDVGAGKTAVAAAAALAVLAAGYQVALMAPTELLAEQHHNTFSSWFEALEVPVYKLSGRLSKRERGKVLEAIRTRSDMFVCGTHALFQEQVQFCRLGLVIIDEQHRFGVDQRLALRDKGRDGDRVPHQLIMTATPIPRTLAMTAYADLDVSVIDELPPGRKPVNTVVIPESRRPEVTERIAAAIAAGRQVYWVCPLIEESEALQAEAATQAAASLAEALPGARVGLVHGRQKDDEKDQVVRSFRKRELDLLVATTVIEVGVDVPNASLMVIENAERLGLSQLHQLRGRIGRGALQSDCVLLYRPPLAEMARERLHVIRTTNDGFVVAERDLSLRGPGEVLGTRQSGASSFHIADIVRDAELLPTVAAAGERLHDQHPAVADAIIDRWLGAVWTYGTV
ncbi:MAG: ATP-dependent DNA helicase RecG [Gammaproteobacteria bacterium]|nr:ATP-dependent DNA helicase RecG [Gammaproteobacteria bacterium]